MATATLNLTASDLETLEAHLEAFDWQAWEPESEEFHSLMGY